MATLAKNIKTDYQVINSIIVAVEPFIDNLMNRYEKSFKENGAVFTNRDREYFELAVISSLVKAVAKYTDKNDKIVGDIDFTTSQGNVSITCCIERNGEKFYFRTYTIVAEGMVQQRHLRYLVTTSIRPTSNEKDALKEIKEVEKAMKKEDKLIEEVKYYENRIKTEKEKLQELVGKTSEEIIASSTHRVRNYHYMGQPNFENEEHFNNWLDELDKEAIELNQKWIKLKENEIKSLFKGLEKAQQKIESFLTK